jgi:hypothetical protein
VIAAAMPSAGAQTMPVPATTPTQAVAPPTSPPPPTDRGRFAAIWVAPLATHQFQGAGVEAGYRYHWLAGLYRLGFLQNGYAPADALTLERTQRVFLDLELDGQWRFHDAVTLAVGGGVAFIGDRVDIASMNGPTWATTTDDRGKVRPLVSETLAGPIFESSVTFYVGPNPEVRLSLGVCWGRHARH